MDLVVGRFGVVQTLQRIKGHGLVEGQPKTPRSRRSVPLSPQAVEVLHAIRGQQMEQQLEAGHRWLNTGYVFTQVDGSPIAPDMISKDFCAIVREAGLPKMTFHGLRRQRFHDLRHSCASLLISQGVQPRDVMEILGHSTISMTMNRYAHVIQQTQREAAGKMGQVLSG